MKERKNVLTYLMRPKDVPHGTLQAFCIMHPKDVHHVAYCATHHSAACCGSCPCRVWAEPKRTPSRAPQRAHLVQTNAHGATFVVFTQRRKKATHCCIAFWGNEPHQSPAGDSFPLARGSLWGRDGRPLRGHLPQRGRYYAGSHSGKRSNSASSPPSITIKAAFSEAMIALPSVEIYSLRMDSPLSPQ